MAGVKRRSGYRKGVEEEVLYGTPEPGDNQFVARIARSHGSNLFEVATSTGATGLALLPTKFRKLAWLKRGDFVIVSGATGDFETAAGEEGRVGFLIEHVLYADAVKHLRKVDKWPAAFDKPVARAAADAGASGGGGGGGRGASAAGASSSSDEESGSEEKGEGSDSEGGSSSSSSEDEALFLGRRRQGPRDLPPSDSEEEESEGGEGDRDGVTEGAAAAAARDADGRTGDAARTAPLESGVSSLRLG